MKRIFISLLLCTVALSTTTNTAVANPIKVLHVSEWMQNEAQQIIDSVGAGGLFDVTQISYWDEFHNSPPDNLDDYDVIVFGLSDCYDLHRPLYELMDFIENGGGIVFTHDTMDHVSPDTVRTIAGIGTWLDPSDWVWGESAEIIQEHAVLHFPYDIGDVGDTFAIQSTHTIDELLPNARKIIKFPGSDATNNYYLAASEYRDGRVILSHLGHTVFPCQDPYPGIDAEIPAVTEGALLVNCLYWACMDTPDILCADLIAQVESLGLPKGIENSLIAKLENVAKKLEDQNIGAAINMLQAFINEVEAQHGKEIPQADADDLIAAAEEIIEVLSSI